MKRAMVLCAIVLTAATAAAQQAPGKKVLLAWEKTEFKQALIEEMERLLVEQGFVVTKATHSKAGLAAKAADFDAVFITNSGVDSKVRPWIVEWLAANKEYAARIVLHTTQTSGWTVKAEVDAVTSASAKSDVKSLAGSYVARIGKIVAPAGAK